MFFARFLFRGGGVPDDEGELLAAVRTQAADVWLSAMGGTRLASARSSDAAIGSLVIFLRCGSLPGL